MKIVGKYDNSFSANLAKNLLEEEGIKAFILNENINYSIGPTNTDLLSIELVVEDCDYERSIKVLEDTSNIL